MRKRENRFWAVGIGLVLMPPVWFTAVHIVFKVHFDVLYAVFYGFVFLLGLSLIDSELAGHWWDKLIRLASFWRKRDG